MSHSYTTTVRWTGNQGAGTADYKAYSRDHEITKDGAPPMPGSADPAFRGDGERWNPEDSLTGALSACHMLWFLHLACQAGWVVESYEDEATAEMSLNADGSGEFTIARLRPRVTISAGNTDLNDALHEQAHAKCFIARSVNFPIDCRGTVTRA